MEFGGILTVMKRWWWVLLLSTCLAALAGYVVASQGVTEYESRTRLLVGPINTERNILNASENLTRTYSELVTSQTVLQATIDELGLTTDPARLASAISPTADSATRILIIRVADTEPSRAAAIANELAAQLTALAGSGSERPEGALTVIDPAQAGVPVGTNIELLTLLAALGGAVMAFTVVLLVEYLRESVASDAEIAELSGADVLGAVSPMGRQPGGDLAVEAQPRSSRAATYRLLTTKIALAARTRNVRTIVVLGTRRASGVGELAGNLAASLGEQGKRVMLVDADHVANQVTTLLGLRSRDGLGELMLAQARGNDYQADELTKYIVPHPNMWVLPAGRRGQQPVTADPGAADKLLVRLHEHADVVVINAASPDRSPAALVWAGQADATVLAVNRSRTPRQDLVSAADSLRLVGATVIGTVLTTGSGRIGALLPIWAHRRWVLRAP